tara:strand:+ start:203 stop:385 length:183 start_codon:yes stop_codon:yes gene_type:complete
MGQKGKMLTNHKSQRKTKRVKYTPSSLERWFIRLAPSLVAFLVLQIAALLVFFLLMLIFN